MKTIPYQLPPKPHKIEWKGPHIVHASTNAIVAWLAAFNAGWGLDRSPFLGEQMSRGAGVLAFTLWCSVGTSPLGGPLTVAGGALRLIPLDEKTELNFGDILRPRSLPLPDSETELLHAYCDGFVEFLRQRVRVETMQVGDDISPDDKHKGGRPRDTDDDWAYQEIKSGRDQAEVYREWLERIPKERRANLGDPQDSFKKAMSYRRKKEKRE